MSTATASETATSTEPRDNKMPSSIWFIVSNEFAERFCFYGINSILVAFMVGSLEFTDAKAVSYQALFKSAAYFFPVLGAVVSDVFWGKFRTIFVFSIFYATGCVLLALFGSSEFALVASLGLVALGTGGIKPCVSTNVGDQFTAKNQHLIERAFSMFYMAINAGSSISIYLCPELLKSPEWGPRWAFGAPAIMMVAATMVFIAGRARYAKVPPAGQAWVKEVLSPDGIKLILSLLGIYLFVALFWMLWDQSNGGAWVLQAQSPLMDKRIIGNFTLLGPQVQVVNGLFILALAPVLSYGVYPFINKFVKVTPLRKIGTGLFVVGVSFVVIALIEQRMMKGETVSVWWQFLAYAILTVGELLVSVTALEFSYKQAPLRIKSFIMSLFLLSTSVGNLLVAAVNFVMVKPVHVSAVQTGDDTWVTLDEASAFTVGQKLDFTGETGVLNEKNKPLSGTFLVDQIDGSRVHLITAERTPVKTAGALDIKKNDQGEESGTISTYSLVGAAYYYFFVGVIWVATLIFAVYASFYKERTFVRTEGETPSASA